MSQYVSKEQAKVIAEACPDSTGFCFADEGTRCKELDPKCCGYCPEYPCKDPCAEFLASMLPSKCYPVNGEACQFINRMAARG